VSFLVTDCIEESENAIQVSGIV